MSKSTSGAAAPAPTRYRYSGPLSGVTLADGQETLLHPGATVPLQADHPYTQSLLARGHLVPLAEAASTPPTTRS